MTGVTRGDYPQGESDWKRDVDRRLRELHTMLTRRPAAWRLEVVDDQGRTAALAIDPNTGNAAIRSSEGGVVVEHGTSTEAANARIDPETGEIMRVTSSEAGKVDVRDMTVTTDVVAKVRAMRRRMWRDATEVRRNPNTGHWIPGWIAEELHAAGLGAFVEYDATGAPIAVGYDRVPVLLHAWLASVAEQVDQHQAALASLVAGAQSTATALGALIARMNTAEATIKNQGEQIKALQDKNAEQDKQLATLTANVGALSSKLGVKL